MTKVNSTWRESLINLSAGQVKEVTFLDTRPNIFEILSKTGGDIYISETPDLTNSKYEMNIPPNGKKIYQKARPVHKLYLLSPTGATVLVNSFEDQYNPSAVSQTQEIVMRADLSKVTVEAMPPLPAGTNNIGKVEVIKQVPRTLVSQKVTISAGGTFTVTSQNTAIYKSFAEGGLTHYQVKNNALAERWAIGNFEGNGNAITCEGGLRITNTSGSVAITVWVLYEVY